MLSEPQNPRPRLTVNIGITGHRKLPPDAEEALRERVFRILQFIKDEVEELRHKNEFSLVRELYSDEEPRYVLLSSLAAGADSLAADEALKLGYELHAPLPLAVGEYEKDFETVESQATFQRLLREARRYRVFEISAAHPERGHAYADAARVVLNHSDVLLALWDGKDTEYVAGTSATIEQASRQHIPVIHLYPDASGPDCIITDGFRSTEWEEKLRSRFRSLLLPVEATPPRSDLRFILSCAGQENIKPSGWDYRALFIPGLIIWCSNLFTWALRWHPIRAIRCWWRSRRAMTGAARRAIRLEEGYPPEVDYVASKKVFDASAPDSREVWQKHYDRFDELANAYSARYRGGLLMRYVAPVLATFFLALALGWDAWHFSGPELSFAGDESASCDCVAVEAGSTFWKTFWFILQAILLLVPLGLQGLDCLFMWHRKYFSYRVVGEQMRQTSYLGPVGFFTVHEKDCTYKDSPSRWTAWYYRALIRAERLPNALVDESYLADWLVWARDRFVVHQLNYHEKRQSREGGMCRRLVRWGVALFMVGVVAAVWRGFSAVQNEDPALTAIAAAFALVVPALAVFCAGFCAYACYAKDQQVSTASSNTLEAIRREMDVFLRARGYQIPPTEEEAKEIAGIQPEALHFSRAYDFATQMNDCCKEELLGWEDLISTKGIKHQ